MNTKRVFAVTLFSFLAMGNAFAADDPIRLGVSLPLTGEIASYGEDLKNGIELAAQDINAKGGVLGRKIEPVIEDDAADPKASVALSNRFLGDRMDAVVNGVSRTGLAIAPIYAEEGIPFLNLVSSDAVTEHGWTNIVRVIPKNGQEAPRLASLIAQKAKGHKLAVIYESEEYSSNLSEKVLQILAQSNGLTPDVVNKISGKDEDYSALISKLKDQKIDVVFLGLWPKGAGLFLRQSAAADYHPAFIGDATASFDDLIKIGGKLTDGYLFTMTPYPQYIPSAQAVVKELADRHIVNHPFAVYAYVLVGIYADAVRQAGTTDPKKVMHALKTKTFTTVLGPASFAANGDMQGVDFNYYEWENGKIVPLGGGAGN